MDEVLAAVVGTYVVTNLSFWLCNVAFVAVDLTGRPMWIKDYKVQQQSNTPVAPSAFLKCLRVVLFNTLVLPPPFLLLAFSLMRMRGCNLDYKTMPSLPAMLADLAGMTLCSEIGFYYWHRFLHRSWWYRNVHIVHHEWKSPISIESVYCHPFEHVTSHVLLPLIAPVVLQAHVLTTWVFLCIGILSITAGHCGYHLPLLPSPEAHDYHHVRPDNNFGVLGMLDWLHGTDKAFRASAAFKRHFWFMGWQPVKTLISDG